MWPAGVVAPPRAVEGRAALYSLGFLLRRAASVLLDIHERELRVGLRVTTQGGQVVGQIFMSDSLENGAGYSSYFGDPARAEALLRFVLGQPGNVFYGPLVAPLHAGQCQTSCPDCLRDFSNLAYHNNRRFLEEWEQADLIETLFEEPFDEALLESDDVVFVDPQGYWDRLIAELLVRPERMRELGDRKFEEFTAELLTRDGFDARLTPRTKDGGLDVLALRRLGIVELMYLVECKRYARTRKVGVQVVRSLYGVVSRKRANAGLIVTTSSFSKPAQLERHELGPQMALKDYDDIVQWMKRLRGVQD